MRLVFRLTPSACRATLECTCATSRPAGTRRKMARIGSRTKATSAAVAIPAAMPSTRSAPRSRVRAARISPRRWRPEGGVPQDTLRGGAKDEVLEQPRDVGMLRRLHDGDGVRSGRLRCCGKRDRPHGGAGALRVGDVDDSTFVRTPSTLSSLLTTFATTRLAKLAP